MATVSASVVQTNYPNYTVVRYTVTGSDVSNFGEIRVLPSGYTINNIDTRYWSDYASDSGRVSPVIFDMYVPVQAAELNFSPASASETSRSIQLWGFHISSNTWQKIGSPVTVYPGYAWLSGATCTTVLGDEQHQIRVDGYTRAWIPEDPPGTYHPERGDCWFQNIGFVESRYVENSDGTLNTTVSSIRVKWSTRSRFIIEQTADGNFAKLSTVATGLPPLTKLYAYGQGKDGVWYLLNSAFVPSTSAYDGSHALHATTTAKIKFDNNGGSGGPGVVDHDPETGSSIVIPSITPTKSVTLTYNANTSRDSGSAVAATVTPASKKINLEFVGWSTRKVDYGSSADYYPGDTYTVTGDSTLYAVWKIATIGALPTYSNSASVSPRIYRNSNGTSYRLHTTNPWTTTSTGSTSVTSSTTIYRDMTIYAQWEYKVVLDLQGGYASTGSGSDDGESITTGPITRWKQVGQTISFTYSYMKLGSTMKGYATSAGGSVVYPYSDANPTINYTNNAPATLYAVWEPQQYKVRFHDGYTRSGSDVIKEVLVPFGGSVPDSQLPVPGQTYNGRVFQKPGGAAFTRWSGSYRNITSDSDVVAIWDFTPVWICVLSGNRHIWIKYEPKEATS